MNHRHNSSFTLAKFVGEKISHIVMFYQRLYLLWLPLAIQQTGLFLFCVASPKVAKVSRHGDVASQYC
jgi:hypothetical protein